jgi:hypothetical protein
MRQSRGAYRVLVGKPMWPPLRRPRYRWKDNIKMDIREVRWWDMDWINLGEDRDKWWALVKMVMNLRVP